MANTKTKTPAYKPYSQQKTQTAKLQSGGRISEFGEGKTGDYSKEYSAKDLGQGKFISRSEYAQKIEQEKGRERAGKLEEQTLKADAAFIKVDNQKEKNNNLKTQGQIIRATGAMLTNEAAYRAAVVPLHLRLRTNQLGILSNAARGTEYAVEVGSAKLLGEGIGGGIDFSKADQHGQKEVEFVEASFDDA